MKTLTVELLTREKFEAYGDVIEIAGNNPVSINSGNCQRYTDLACLDMCNTGAPGISLFDAKAYRSPLTLTYVERHPLGSQAFLPTSSDPYLVVVADDLAGRAFVLCLPDHLLPRLDKDRRTSVEMPGNPVDDVLRKSA